MYFVPVSKQNAQNLCKSDISRLSVAFAAYLSMCVDVGARLITVQRSYGDPVALTSNIGRPAIPPRLGV